jgi:hypothetical protein
MVSGHQPAVYLNWTLHSLMTPRMKAVKQVPELSKRYVVPVQTAPLCSARVLCEQV